MLALPDGAVPLMVGTGLAVGALALVLSPLLSSLDAAAPPPSIRNDPSEDRPLTAVDALREIEFDRVTGKLSESDYTALKTRYTRDALAELRAAHPVAVAATGSHDTESTDDPVEAAIRRARTHVRECIECGPRPESDAAYCSGCGRYLPGSCRACGASVELSGARFCVGCGEQLSAA